ncbi:hypothetical protein [Phormidesmis priestleyi]
MRTFIYVTKLNILTNGAIVAQASVYRTQGGMNGQLKRCILTLAG